MGGALMAGGTRAGAVAVNISGTAGTTCTGSVQFVGRRKIGSM
ncbi:hypothetical protein MB901379_02076 [Mycobacterium basiliense]|uniref:Uncharacterized protein n=1 Tax=Mycobacterium basiliense TaxID=2094119 RepID=A0A447GDK8_9MYCO|nr:hypothetical protein MB901379_02076 [Mycobacterium basiliense]